ncbi:hypothetical protein H181DRAFT_04640 [Streptomyces sp. WMMB 714]|uniref:hypothetical protein n=1 Tax=Streptomyces sp. WMMB 714 TaxID=1286822 RepID=UPI0005F7C725|nr:hypothetical protein [Streptomyces sp. WMMB 714]SCK51291.1 hypothetical protein H181DRAFT_04640 [Streptomyces sp. WMMB 714]
MNLYALMRLAAPPAQAARPARKRTGAATARTKAWSFGRRAGPGTAAEPAPGTGAGTESSDAA